MGYRSDVAYTIRFKKPEDFALFISEAKAHEYGSALTECTVDEKNLRIDFATSDVKWYPTYENVICHTELIKQAESWIDGADHIEIKGGVELGASLDYYKLGYIFVRVGEESNDIEQECGGDFDWDWLHVVRTITIDGEDMRTSGFGG